MSVEQVTHLYGRNGGAHSVRRTVGDALGALVLLLGDRVRVEACSPTLIVLMETGFLDGAVSTMVFEGAIATMRPLFETVQRFLEARAGAGQAPAETDTPQPPTPRHLAALAHVLGINGEEMASVGAMSGEQIALLVRFHVDLGVPVGTLLTAMRRDPKTVRNLTGNWINKAALDAVSELAQTERPGTCPIALARELQAGVELDPRTFGWSAA